MKRGGARAWGWGASEQVRTDPSSGHVETPCELSDNRA